MIRLFSPAKINLFFRVLGARPDGFHEIATLMQAISLGDTLFIQPGSKESLTCTDPALPNDSSNLILKAAQLFREKSNTEINCEYHLIKRVPVEAGLGGGSSNAASVLWGLNQLTGAKFDTETLKEWASALGSDVPFFFSQGTAYCTGKGEKVQEKLPLNRQSLWIAKPTETLSTPAVYRALNLQAITKRNPLSALENNQYFNDLEHSAFQLCPRMPFVREQLYNIGFNTVVMTGSGTAFFCFGQVLNPVLNGVNFYPIEYIQRKKEQWY
jgi:4-diphosphocytidyl-2-C-methyl-D-erythritol kinase